MQTTGHFVIVCEHALCVLMTESVYVFVKWLHNIDIFFND